MGNYFHTTISSNYINQYFDYCQSLAVNQINEESVNRTELYTEPVKEFLDQYGSKGQHYERLIGKHRDYAIVQNQRGKYIFIGPVSVDKKPIGFGKLIRADGGVIFATFLTGEAEGEGLRIYKDGSFFEGNFRAGKAYGKGIYENSSIYYYGNFFDKFEGYGKLTGKANMKYELTGTFRNGVIQKGRLIWEYIHENVKNELIYSGYFNQNGGAFEGYGELTSHFGKYIGQFKDGKKHGQGRFQFRNGMLYVGQYYNDLRHGKGTIYNFDENNSQAYLYRTDLIVYQGYFQHNNPHGQGKITYPPSKKLFKMEAVDNLNAAGSLH